MGSPSQFSFRVVPTKGWGLISLASAKQGGEIAQRCFFGVTVAFNQLAERLTPKHEPDGR